MAYFNQLQGYMSNLKEGQAHMEDMKNEAINKKTTGIEDKFNAITQQAEGWGGAIAQAGIVWKHGRKVVERLGKAKADATTTPTTTTPDPTTTQVGGDGGGTGVEADHITQAANDARAGNLPDAAPYPAATPAPTPTPTPTPAQAPDPAIAPDPAANVLSPSRMVVRGANNQPPVQTGQGVNQGPDPALQRAGAGDQASSTDLAGLRGDQTLSRLFGRTGRPPPNPNTSSPTTNQGGAPRSSGDGRGGGANPNESNLADNAGTLGDDAGSMGSRVLAGVRQVASSVGGEAGGSSVMGAVNATLDSIPIIGEVIGIGTMIGGLIHGLHKGGEEVREGQAQSAGGSGSAQGGIASTKVFSGNTLGSGGGGYIA